MDGSGLPADGEGVFPADLRRSRRWGFATIPTIERDLTRSHGIIDPTAPYLQVGNPWENAAEPGLINSWEGLSVGNASQRRLVCFAGRYMLAFFSKLCRKVVKPYGGRPGCKREAVSCTVNHPGCVGL